MIKITTVMLILCLKHFKDFILAFSISESFFSEKEFLNLYTMIIFPFPLGGCVDEVVLNRSNYQGYLNTYYSVIHFINGKEAC